MALFGCFLCAVVICFINRFYGCCCKPKDLPPHETPGAKPIIVLDRDSAVIEARDDDDSLMEASASAMTQMNRDENEIVPSF